MDEGTEDPAGADAQRNADRPARERKQNGLGEELPRQISRKPFKIRINNPDTAIKQLQLVMVDTSFNSKDVNDDVAILNDEITISENMLNRLVNGPIILEIHSEKIHQLAKKTRKGGKVAMSYSLSREFELVQ